MRRHVAQFDVPLTLVTLLGARAAILLVLRRVTKRERQLAMRTDDGTSRTRVTRVRHDRRRRHDVATFRALHATRLRVRMAGRVTPLDRFVTPRTLLRHRAALVLVSVEIDHRYGSCTPSTLHGSVRTHMSLVASQLHTFHRLMTSLALDCDMLRSVRIHFRLLHHLRTDRTLDECTCTVKGVKRKGTIRDRLVTRRTQLMIWWELGWIEFRPISLALILLVVIIIITVIIELILSRGSSDFSLLLFR